SLSSPAPHLSLFSPAGAAPAPVPVISLPNTAGTRRFSGSPVPTLCSLGISSPEPPLSPLLSAPTSASTPAPTPSSHLPHATHPGLRDGSPGSLESSLPPANGPLSSPAAPLPSQPSPSFPSPASPESPAPAPPPPTLSHLSHPAATPPQMRPSAAARCSSSDRTRSSTPHVSQTARPGSASTPLRLDAPPGGS